MTMLDAILLGIVQGLTEFLPVSSSGHLKLAQYFLGLKNLDHYIIFDLACHLGTLLAVFFFFFQNIKNVFQDRIQLRQVVIGTLPLFPLVFLMKPIKAAYATPSYLGFFFIITSIILFIGIVYAKKIPKKEKNSPWQDALTIGFCQALAILPGISRSGSTISGARILGWNPSNAVSFSFLLAIPAILGGSLLEVAKIWEQPSYAAVLPLESYLAGFLVSFLVGIFALRLLMKMIMQNKFHYFAWYCLILGLATTAYFHYILS
jgi:undecaprenyl-diphosphatase